MSWVSPQTGCMVCRPLTLSGSGTCTIRATACLDWRNFSTTSGFSGTELVLVWGDLQEWFLPLPDPSPNFPLDCATFWCRWVWKDLSHAAGCSEVEIFISCSTYRGLWGLVVVLLSWLISRALAAQPRGVLGVWFSVTASLFTFLYLHLITSKFIYVTSSS